MLMLKPLLFFIKYKLNGISCMKTIVSILTVCNLLHCGYLYSILYLINWSTTGVTKQSTVQRLNDMMN